MAATIASQSDCRTRPGQCGDAQLQFRMGGSVSVNVENGAPPSLWQINGKAWDITDKTCADRPIAKLVKGKSYIFELKNMTQYQHPIHLHGMSFKVIASDRKAIIPYFTDTYLLGKNERARVALVADNPGIWMFHCHVIDHMETGLWPQLRCPDEAATDY